MPVKPGDQLYIIDSTGPFFVKHPREVINWSKVPHYHIEKKGVLPKKRGKKIRTNFEKYVARAAGIGYNAISIDELSRLALADCYPEKLKKRIRRYRKYYRRLFRIAGDYRMGVFITTDVMFFHETIDRRTGGRFDQIVELLREMIDELLEAFPEIDGVIFRMGESDGVDVKGDFRSRIVLRTPAEANRLLRELLPVFEERQRLLIFRTWTVGAHSIGDIMWNPRAYDAAFRGIDSPALIISMKYGESDFFRYLEVNRHFFRDDRKKLVELQTRREYEGFGEFPSFVGFQYEAYRDALEQARGLVGIHVWCQTGGWSRFRNFTFLKNTSYWNELNTHVTLKLFRERMPLRRALRSFLEESADGPRAGKKSLEQMLEFLRLSDEVICDALYDPAFATRPLYVNRARIPPLLHVFWDNVTVTDHVRALYLAFASGGEESVRRARASLQKIGSMRRIARRLELPYDHDFHYATFRLFVLCRELIYAPGPDRTLKRLKKRLRSYNKRYPGTYNFNIQVEGHPTPMLQSFLRLALREKRAYRAIDRFLFNGLMARLYLALFEAGRKKYPSFVNNQGMPIDKILG